MTYDLKTDPSYTTITFKHPPGKRPPKMQELIDSIFEGPTEDYGRIVAVYQGSYVLKEK